MDPLTLMLLFGAGSAIFGAGTSFLGNKMAQGMSEDAMAMQFENQMKLQKDAQEFSTQQMKDQQQFALDFWNKNNEYNSQSAIDQRLRDAGRNPYLSNNSNVAAVTTSPGSASGAGQGSAALANPQFTPLANLGQLFVNSGVQSSQMLSFLEDVKGKKIDNYFRGAEAIMNLKKLGVDIEGGQLRNYMQRITNMFAKDMAEQDYLTKLETNKNLRLQGQSMGYTIAAQALQNAYLPQQLKLDIAMKNAELYTEFQRGQLTKAQYKYQLIQSMIGEEKYKQEQVNTDVSQRTKEDVIQQTHNESMTSGYQRFHAELDYKTASRIADYIVEKAYIETAGSSGFLQGIQAGNLAISRWSNRLFGN